MKATINIPDKFKKGDRVKLLCPDYMVGLTGTITHTEHGYMGIAKYYHLELDEYWGWRALKKISRSERELEFA